MASTIWAATGVTPAATDRLPVDVGAAGAPSRWTGQQVSDIRSYVGGTVNALGSVGTNQSVSLADGRYISATITGNVQFTFTSVPSGATDILLQLTNGGAHTVSFAATVNWSGGTTPSLQSSGADLIRLYTTDGGTTFIGELASDEQTLAASSLTGQVALANGGTGANLTDPNADRILFWDDSAGAATWLTVGTGLTITDTTITASGGSANTKWIGAGELIPRVTNGAGIDGEELATNDINLDYLAFDSATSEGAQVSFAWPGAYTTFAATFHWTAASGSGTVTWTAAARCYADDDALDQAQGTAQSVTDTLLAANDAHKSAATSAVTPAGTVASGNLTVVQITRDIADTLAVDARLIGVLLEFA